ncbi:peptidylprolyl isomerase [Chitinophaga tropicalis]|uniref:Periplasmic chaperone PpiD n=1 Tax=Chitinophaga tropicalis TaxID=2683588 RepID=A0A7K1TYL4_9BACT|nr:peptidylprolyl isomerase [Chitinophaga tropicalis]MVT07130.1 hypothetical protein [Chitinophaga tropicalis]
MSVIQKIRDKYAVVIVVVICLAIVSFLLQDAFFGRNSIMRRSTTVGKVNGEELDLSEYQQRIKVVEDRLRQGNPTGSLNDQLSQQARETAWNQFLSEKILNAQYEKLGIAVSEAEISDQFNGKNPNPVIVRQFTDEKTGQFDRARMQQILQSVGQDKTGQTRARLLELEDYIAQSRISAKYLSLISKAVYYPKWMAEQQIKDNSQYASVSYVAVPYSTIADSTVKVTDSELKAYIDDHKEMFKTEESRKVEYLAFNVIPSAADSAAALKVLFDEKAEMDTTSINDIAGFINRNSDLPFYDGYVAKSALMVPQKDTIASLPVGAVFGPYYDNNLIVFAKMIDRKMLPDSVKVRHILIASGQQGGLPDSIAKVRIDSIKNAVKGGADFKALVDQYTDDVASKATGGEYDVTPSTDFLKEFKDFALEKEQGTIDVVKTLAGYHLIQVMERKNIGQALKIAYLAKPVSPSRETDSKAYADANEFASKNRDQKTFEKTIQEKGLNKRIADNLHPMDHVISGVGQARELVRWAYEAKKGDVSNVFTFDNTYVVAVLSAIREEGTASLDEVRPAVEAEVKKHKKAESIIAELKSPASLDAVVKATKQPEQKAEGINFGSPFIASMGYEPRVVGAIYNPAWGPGKISAPVEGNAGVYVLRVDAFQPTTQAQDAKSVSRAYEQSVASALDQQLFLVLKKLSKVEDNRGKFF